MEAIQAATTRSAEASGVEDVIGTLETGKEADLIAVEGDPLYDIRVLRNPSLVMKGGIIIPRIKTTVEYRREYGAVLQEYEKILKLWEEVIATY